MKKTSKKQLRLSRQSVRRLTAASLDDIRGGATLISSVCHYQTDTCSNYTSACAGPSYHCGTTTN